MSCVAYLTKKKQENIKAIKEYLTYLDARKRFEEEDKGIFHPIRAIVKVYSKNNFRIQDVLAEAMNIQSIIDLDEIETKKDAIAAFVPKSTIVGYFTTRIAEAPHPTVYGIGYSFCRPSDYPLYQKHIGMLSAIPMRHVAGDVAVLIDNMETTKMESFAPALSSKAHHKFILEPVGDDGLVVYFFPISIEDQFMNFLDRCKRYYHINK